jgi:alpha,alpha-trehalase
VSGRPGHDRGDYPPIGEHAFLSDCHTGALVGPDGAVDWLCAPRFDGEPVFARLLDRRDGGALHVGVAGAGDAPERRYVPGTLVLESRWAAGGDRAVAHDFLAVGSGRSNGSPSLVPRGVLVRLVRCTAGSVRVRARADARPRWQRSEGGWETGGETAVHPEAGLWLGSDGPGAASPLHEEVELRAGDAAVVALGYRGDPPRHVDRAVAERLLDETIAAWTVWSDHTTYDGIGAADVRHSAVVLRGLLFEETGALLAAPTTSLPEWLGGARNWDYRFTWHRDASLAVLVLLRTGHTGEARRYLRFLLEHDAHAGDALEPLLGIGGETELTEWEPEGFEGYAGSAPVRAGNEARGQEQLDSYGHVLDAALALQAVTGELTPDDVAELHRIVGLAVKRWRDPDHGIWEVRSERRHWTNSKVMAWVCVDRGIRLAEITGERRAPLDEWRRERELIRADVLEHGYDERRGAFVQTYGSDALDASLLRMPLLGFIAGDDPRMLSTVERIDEELGGPGGLVHRYDTDATDDGMDDPEGAFLMCSFDMVSALVLARRVEEAQERFDALCRWAAPLGLMPEQAAGDGTALGNHPQAFSHLALIEAAMNLDAAGRSDALRDWAERHAGPGAGTR